MRHQHQSSELLEPQQNKREREFQGTCTLRGTEKRHRRVSEYLHKPTYR
jgi:hypothetical protein